MDQNAHATRSVVRSADGTEIAFHRSGSGPAVVLVDPALGYSGFDHLRTLGALLAERFSVYTYDRRGRGGSGDAEPYHVAREVEDLAAVIGEAGGSACVYGFSSGALLALQAAASGLAIERLAVFEPPGRAEGNRLRPSSRRRSPAWSPRAGAGRQSSASCVRSGCLTR